MNNPEAKFILGAYRPDGRDASDPTFAESLAQAERDPDLRAWFEKQRKFDSAMAAKMNAIVPPPGLKEAILAGSRVSATKARRSWWSNPVWLAAAAVIVLAAIAGVKITSAPARPTGADFAAFALRDLAEAHDHHVGHPPGLADVQARLANAQLPLTRTLDISLAELVRQNCRSVQVAGRDVFELCFQRDGTWYHVYIGRRKDFAPGVIDPHGVMNQRDQYASTAWAEGDQVYALVTHAGAEALRRVI